MTQSLQSSRELEAGTATRYIVMCQVAVMVLLCVAIASLEYIPFADYPNHISRAFILGNFGEFDWMRKFYVVDWKPTPNVLGDVLLVGLASAIGLLTAAKVLVILTLLLWVAAVNSLSLQVHGRLVWMTVPVAMLPVHGALQYGFINYSLGLPLALLTVAAWLKWRDAVTHRWLPVVILLATLTYLSHLAAYGILGVACGAIVFDRLYRDRQALVKSLASILPLCAPIPFFLYFMGNGGKVGTVEYSSLFQRGIIIFSVIRSYRLPMDIIAAMALILLLATLLWAVKRQASSLSRSLVSSILALSVAFILLPKTLFTASGVDARIPPAIVILSMLAFSEPIWRNRTRFVFVLCTCIFATRLALQVVDLMSLSLMTKRYLSLGAKIERGQYVLGLYSDDGGLDNDKRHRVLSHAAHYLTVLRGAYVPALFASASQQPLTALRWGEAQTTNFTLLKDEVTSFDYVIATGKSARAAVDLAKCCELESSNELAALFRVVQSR